MDTVSARIPTNESYGYWQLTRLLYARAGRTEARWEGRKASACAFTPQLCASPTARPGTKKHCWPSFSTCHLTTTSWHSVVHKLSYSPSHPFGKSASARSAEASVEA